MCIRDRLFCVSVFLTVCDAQQVESASASAQKDKTANLPTAEQVIDRHIMAKGGYEVLSSISTMRTVWTKTDGRGKWKFERWRIPGRKFAEQSLDGEIERTIGCVVANPSADVKSLKGVSWWDSGNGIRLEGGLELQENLVDAATLDNTTRWEERYKSVVIKGIEKLHGKECYLLEFTNHDDEVAKQYFDVETYYRVCSIKIEHDSGGREVTRTFSNFKEIDGIVVSMKQTIDSASGQDIWEIQEFEHGREIDFDDFPLPEEVAAAFEAIRSKLSVESDNLVNSQ